MIELQGYGSERERRRYRVLRKKRPERHNSSGPPPFPPHFNVVFWGGVLSTPGPAKKTPGFVKMAGRPTQAPTLKSGGQGGDQIC